MSTTLSVEEVLDRIEAAFGQRPTANAVHLAVSRARSGTGSTAWRSSLTSGLPEARETRDGLVFDQAQVEEWIRGHPARAGDRLAEGLEPGQTAAERVTPVARARGDGMSWERIAQVIARVDDRPVSRELVRRVFTPLVDEAR